jgi:pyruvate formate-lyase activating enzyme-like uncharacterized protein
MRILPIQEAYSRKFERQKQIKELQVHAGGHCVHIGKLSPGCYSCFVPDRFKKNIVLGGRCNRSCAYCTEIPGEEPKKTERLTLKALLLRDSRSPDYDPRSMSFSGGGEPLLYVDILEGYMRVFQEIEKETGKRPWFHLYTNGLLAGEDVLLRLRDLGLDEIRFHLGASNFSARAYRNLKRAVRLLKRVSVETPAWPLHRKKLFEMLPVIHDLGVRHLNIGEIEIRPGNVERIARAFPDGEIYPCFEMHLWDGGLVYDLMEEAVKRKYSFSVLDCSSFVKSIQRSPAKFVGYEDVKGLVAED